MSNRSQLFTAENDGLGVEVVWGSDDDVLGIGIFCRDRQGRDCVLVGSPDADGDFVLTRGAGVAPGEWPQPPAERIIVGKARFGLLESDPGLASLRLIDLDPELGPVVSPRPPAINAVIALYPVTV